MRIVMVATGKFAEPILQSLLKSKHEVVAIITQPESACPSGRVGNFFGASQNGVPVAIMRPKDINKCHELIKSLNIDLMVVASYGQILSESIIKIPKRVVNVHGSLLPKYRGASPVAAAILNGELTTGVSIIEVVPKVDAGKVFGQSSTEIRIGETAGQLEERLAELGANALIHVIKNNFTTCFTQYEETAKKTQTKKLKKQDGLIDWKKSANMVCNHIRAMQPWPNAFTFYGSKRLIIWDAAVVDDLKQITQTPGTILYNPKRLYVAAQEGVVEILELQPESKRKMSAQSFLLGLPVDRKNYILDYMSDKSES